MNTYEREAIGNIVIIKNIIFRNSIFDQKKETDHSWKQGRPCVIIHSDNEYDYFLAMKSNPDYEKYKQQFIPINDNNLLDIIFSRHNKHRSKQMRKKGVIGAINLENIYKIPISGHDEIGKLTFETYKHVIERFKEYHKVKDLNEIVEKAQTIRGR